MNDQKYGLALKKFKMIFLKNIKITIYLIDLGFAT